MKLYLTVPILLTLLSACTVNPYRRTNKIYRDSAKVYARQMTQAPLTSGVDSVPEAKYKVWTTNFNLRKPNFVILHHTAQNSCPETLNTFTTARTQVSAHYVICRDGVVQIAVGSEGLWKRFCSGFDVDPGTPGLATNSERVANRSR